MGVWQRVFKRLTQDTDNKYILIDSTIVCAHLHSAEAKKGGLKNAKPLGSTAVA